MAWGRNRVGLRGRGCPASVTGECRQSAAVPAALLAAVLAVALFAVSLSFVIFQLSPYRSLIPGASGRHLVGVVAVLALALVPVVALTFSPNASAHVSIAVLPVLVLSSVLLVYLAQREASGDVLLSRRVSKLAIREGCFALVRPLRRQTQSCGQSPRLAAMWTGGVFRPHARDLPPAAPTTASRRLSRAARCTRGGCGRRGDSYRTPLCNEST